MLDRNNHPICRSATQVIFACFISYCILGVLYFSRNHLERSPAFDLCVAATSFILISAILAYVHPRGFAAFIVSTAIFGLIAAFGLYEAGSYLLPHGPWGTVLATLAFLLWTTKGIVRTINDRKQAAKLNDPESDSQKSDSMPSSVESDR